MPVLTPEYVSLQGEIILHERDSSGNPLTGFWVGDANNATFKAETNETKYKENYSGKRATALTVENEIVTGFDFTFLQLHTKNLAELFRGEEVAQSTSAVTNKVISGDTLAVGDRLMLGAEEVSAVTIEDSTGTPKTLTAGTNYEIDLVTGRIKILDLTTGGPFVGPLKADFTPGASNSVKLLTGVKKQFWLSLVGVNTVVSGQPKGVLDLYKFEFSLPAAFAVINDTRGEFAVSGSVLSDALKSASGALGQIGRIQGFGIT